MIRTSLAACALAGAFACAPSFAADFARPLENSRRAFGAYVLTLTATAEGEARPFDDQDQSAGLDAGDAVAEAAPELSPEMEALSQRIERTLTWYYDRPENVAQRSPWGVMHALISYGVDTQVIAGNRRVSAIGWLCYNGPCRDQRLFYLRNGQLTPREGPGVQGHPGQFLAMLAQSRVKTDFPIRVDGKSFTVQDLIEYEQRTCRSRTELTFKLIALSHYLPSDATWKNDLGETWSIERLIREEMAQPIVGATCGGTHRLTGISYAVKKRLSRGEPFTGEWERARVYEQSYQQYIYRLQNRDGSFSTQWFAGRGDSGDDDKRLETTGHMLEWLVYSLPREELDNPRVVAAVHYLNELLWRNRNRDLAIGPKGHGLHALVIYQQRMFGAQPGQRLQLANKQK